MSVFSRLSDGFDILKAGEHSWERLPFRFMQSAAHPAQLEPARGKGKHLAPWGELRDTKGVLITKGINTSGTYSKQHDFM
jgi:hypothetical protein